MLLLACITLAHVPFISVGSIIFLIHLGLISTLYNVPKKSKGIVNFPLRSIPVLKIFLIAYVWSSISSFLPAIIENEQVFNSKNIFVFIAHLMFIISITLPFDIRDFEDDNKENLITFPQVIGIWLTKLVAILCIVFFTLIIHGFVGGWYIPFFSLVTAILILSATSKRKDYYFTFYLDGTIILYFIVLILSLA